MMYFRVDYQTTKAMLIPPIFFRNFGYVVIAIVLITNLVRLPFHHFFQGVAVQGMVSAACGALLGSAILQRLFDHITAKNFQLISASFDRLNPDLTTHSASGLGFLLENQVLMLSIKELYGLLVIAGLGCLIVFLFYKYPYFSLKKGVFKWKKTQKEETQPEIPAAL